MRSLVNYADTYFSLTGVELVRRQVNSAEMLNAHFVTFPFLLYTCRRKSPALMENVCKI